MYYIPYIPINEIILAIDLLHERGRLPLVIYVGSIFREAGNYTYMAYSSKSVASDSATQTYTQTSHM